MSFDPCVSEFENAQDLLMKVSKQPKQEELRWAVIKKEIADLRSVVSELERKFVDLKNYFRGEK